MTDDELEAETKRIRRLDLIPAHHAIEIAGLAGAKKPYQSMQYYRNKLGIEVHFNGWYTVSDAYRIREMRRNDK